jgi:hypothetical protein
MSEWWQAFWYGVMVAYTPGLVVLAIILWRTVEGSR